MVEIFTNQQAYVGGARLDHMASFSNWKPAGLLQEIMLIASKGVYKTKKTRNPKKQTSVLFIQTTTNTKGANQ